MRILIATGLYTPEIGGPATHIAFLENHIKGAEYDFHIVPFSSVRMYPKVVRHVVYFFKLLSSSKNADTIYALDPVSVGFPAAVVSFFTGKPLVVRIAGDYAWEQGVARSGVDALPHEFVRDYKKYGFLMRVLGAVERCVAKKSVHIITPSNYLRDVIIDWGIEQSKISVVYNPHITQDILIETEERNEIVILVAGRLVALKQINIIIDAFSKLKEKHSHLMLRIAGDGTDREVLEDQVCQMNLSEDVQFLGALSKDDLHTEMRSADMFILNSIHETFPNIILEALSAKLPVITTRVGGTIEVIDHEVNGLLIKSGDIDELCASVTKIIEDKKLRINLIEGGIESLKKFSVSKITENWKSVMNKIQV